jgi:hypothetical protein
MPPVELETTISAAKRHPVVKDNKIINKQPSNTTS